MKAYCLKLLAAAALAYAAMLAVLCTVRGPVEAEYWVREAAVVKRHLAAQIAGPKVVFLGGSATLFGIDAAQMEKILGVPVFNDGLHAALRLPFLLDEGRQVVKPGDLLVLSLEAKFYAPQPAWTGWQVTNAVAWDPASLDGLPLARRLAVFASSAPPDLWWDLLVARATRRRHGDALFAQQPEEALVARYEDGSWRGRNPGNPYQAWTLDRRGDIPPFSGSPLAEHGRPLDQPDGIAPEPRAALARFVAEMTARGVRVALAYPPYLVEGQPAADWPRAEARFREAAAGIGCPVIERRDAAFYPRDLFYDFSYHLNAAGRERHTAQLAEALLRGGFVPKPL